MTAVRSAPPTAEMDLDSSNVLPEPQASVEDDGLSRLKGARVVALGVLLLGLLTTILVSFLISGQVDRENAVRLDRAQDALEQDLDARIAIYMETLVGMQGLFAGSEAVSRDEFISFTEAANTFERFPGLQGLSFSPVVMRENLAEYEAGVRADTSANGVGYPEFAVRTDGDSPDLIVVDYIVPFEGNEAAFGFDLGSNPARRAAIEEARDTGLTVATAPITLVQETEEQVGVLLLAPSYDGPSANIEERRENFRGVFSAVLRIGDFLNGASSQSDLRFAIFDDSPDQLASEDGRARLYGTGESDYPGSSATFELDVAGRVWGIVLDPDSVPTGGQSRTLILLGGLVAALPYALASYFSYRERDRLNTQAAALRAANAEIQTSNADLERFAYIAAHDLRSPMRGVRNVVDMLDDELREAGHPPAVYELLDHLDRSASKMDSMVQGLLEFATIGGAPISTWEAVDAKSVALEAVQAARAEDEAADGEVDVSADIGQLHTVRGNPVLIERLFENLISNAFKYRNADRQLEIRVSSEQTGSHIAFSIADNGIGIAPEHHDRIFEIFRRLHGPDDIDGRGLGLALCRKIVEHHGGRIWVTSTAGAGAKFTFTLPGTHRQ